MKTDITLNDEAFEPREPEISERLRFLRRSVAKHKWAALGLALVIVVGTAYVVYSARPIYRGTATLFIEPDKQNVVKIEEVSGGPAGNPQHLYTQAEILKSHE